MRRRLHTILIASRLAVLCLLLVSGAGAQEPTWTLLGPGSGPRQFHLMVADPQDGRVLYAGGQEGLYKSQDRGDTWKRVFGDSESVWWSYHEGGPRALVVDPQDNQVVFFGGEPGVLRSTDGGQHWQQMSKVNARALAIEPQGLGGVVGPSDGRAIYVGGDHRIYQSVDQGETWRLARDSLDVYALTIVPQDQRIVYAGCIEGLYRSPDRGLTWERIHAYSFSQLIVDPRDSQVLYGLRDGFAVFKSTDGGRTWTQSGNAPRQARYHVLLLDPGEPSTLYAADLNGVYRSVDSGATWLRLRDSSGSYLALALDPRQSRFLYVGTEEWNGAGTRVSSRFYRSEDRGASWLELPLHIQALALARDPQETQVLYASTDRGIYRSENAGQSWVLANAEHSFHALIADPQNPRRLVGGGHGLYQSEDQGKTWAQVPDLEGRMVSALFTDSRQPARFYAIASGAVFQSLDQGKTWIDSNRELRPISVRSLTVAPQDNLTLYAGTANGVYRSTNGGSTWTQVTVPFEVKALAIASSPPYTIYASATGSRDAWIYSSADEGRTWALSAPLPSRRSGMEGPIPPEAVSLVVDPRHSQMIYMATKWDGIYRSEDGGATWTFFDAGLSPARGEVPAYDWYSRIPYLLLPPSPPHILYAATEWGLFSIDLPPIPGPSEEGEDSTTTTEGRWTSTGPSATLYGGFNLGIAVSSLAVDPQAPRVLYAGTASGRVFKRVPDGTWSQVGAGLPGTAILDLAVDPQNEHRVYAGVEGRPAIYQSENGGQRWQPANGNTLFGSVYAVAFDPQDPQILYGAMNTLLVKTLDGGRSWDKVLIAPAQFSSIAIDPRDSRTVYAGAKNPQTVYGEGGPWESGVYKSADSGAHWQLVMEGSVVEVALDNQDPKTLYALIEEEDWSPWLMPTHNKVYKSTDGGQSWEELETSLPGDSVSALATDPQQQGVLYIAAMDRIFKSVDGGQTWTDMEAGLPNNTPVHTLAVGAGDPCRFFAATGHGVYSNEALHNPSLERAEFPLLGTDASTGPFVWTPSGIQAPIRDLVIAPSDPRVMYAVAGGKATGEALLHDLYRRGPDGRWVLVSAEVISGFTRGIGVVSGFLVVDPHDSETLYTDGVRKSADGGRTWTRVTIRDWGVYGYTAAIDPRDPQVIYVGGAEYLERSADGGKRWSNSAPRGYPEILFGSLAIDPYDPQTLYAGSVDSRLSVLFKREGDSGRWRQVIAGSAGMLAVDWQAPNQVYALIDSTLYHSDDRGERWKKLPLGLEHPPLTALALDWQHSGTLYVAGWGQVFKSTDYGGRWEKLGTRLPDTEVQVLAVDPLYPQAVYAGTAKGLYTTGPVTAVVVDTPAVANGDSTANPADSTSTAGEDTTANPADSTSAAGGDTTGSRSGQDDPPQEAEPPPLPTTTALGQSFPNPFNFQATIPYQLAVSAPVLLEIFDLQGHRVRTIEKGTQPPGFYQEVWNRRDDQGQKLASGVYLVRLQAGGYSALRKVLLVK